MDFDYPSDVCFSCNCCGICCADTDHKLRHILLLESEAEEISNTTGKPIEDFANESNGTHPYIYEMKKQYGDCIFLKDNKCTIYELRPLICRFYPFELKYSPDKRTHVFTVTKECPMIGQGKPMLHKDFEALYHLASERLP
ncbi:MAG: YkgJ family cysteine cluster protein [Methanocella sp.]